MGMLARLVNGRKPNRRRLANPQLRIDAGFYPNSYKNTLHPAAYAVPDIDDRAPTTLIGDGQAPGYGRAWRTHSSLARDLAYGDSRTSARKPAERAWLLSGRGREQLRRHRVEDLDGNGWRTTTSDAKRMAQRPYPAPIAERPTSRGHADLYSFTRPFNQRFAHKLNGKHLSLASTTREYDILGMAPVQTRRNTYRIEPTPWDTAIVDMPDNAEAMPTARYVSPPAVTRQSFRLS